MAEDVMTTEREELLIAVADQIHSTPKRYDQSCWYRKRRFARPSHCIGGWIITKAGGTYDPRANLFKMRGQVVVDNWKLAGDLIGLGRDERNLLFGGSWKPREPFNVSGALRYLAEDPVRSVFAVTCDTALPNFRPPMRRSPYFGELE